MGQSAQLSLLGQGLWCRLRSGQQMQPSKSWAAGSTWGFSLMSCRMLAILEELCCQVEELQEEGSRLRSIREDGKRDKWGLLQHAAA